MSARERCKAHYGRGLALENFANFLDLFRPMPSDRIWKLLPPWSEKANVSSREFLEEAVIDFHFAHHISREDSKLAEGLMRVNGRLADNRDGARTHTGLAAVYVERRGCVRVRLVTYGSLEHRDIPLHFMQRRPQRRKIKGIGDKSLMG